jgi:DNA-binding transcriptional LysR family regulator
LFELRGLSIDQLRTLLEVIELGSFSAAARKLNLTQPAISLQIRELENRCGVRLVKRAGKVILPTAAGRDLIVHAERITTEADRALAAMRSHRSGHLGSLHVGTGPTVLAFLLHPVLHGLREHYPNLGLVVTTGTTGDIVEKLLSNAIDLGFTALPVENSDLVVTPVRTDEIVAILPATETDIPSALTPADVARRTLISEFQRGDRIRMSRAWMNAGGFEARPSMVLDDIEARIRAVAAGLGMGFIPRPVGDQGPSLAGTVVRRLKPRLMRTLAIVQRRDQPDSFALCVVREALLGLANLPRSHPTGSQA